MKHGKYICNTLKQIRLDIARANGIEYAPAECHHEGECAGTCPACESEVRFLEREIARRRSLGKAALVAGVSLGLSSLAASPCYAQTNKIPSADDQDELNGKMVPVKKTKENPGVRPEVFGRPPEPMPVFPGGYDALIKYISENIQYPPEAIQQHIEGKVLVNLQVDTDGKVTEAIVVGSVDKLLDEEAIRVCKSLPDFTPGRIVDRPVISWIVIPVSFKLEGDDETETLE